MEHLHQSPTDPDFVQNPYPFYERTRAGGDLFFWEDYGMVCATGHAAVNMLLRDRRLGREVPEGRRNPIPEHLQPFYDVEAHSMLELEAPRHTRLRRLVLRAFTSRRIKALGPEIAALCHQLIDDFPPGEVELLSAYATQVPVIIIARLLGVPEERKEDLLRWSNAMVKMYQAGRTAADEAEAVAATEAFVDFMRGYVEARRGRPADDLISHLIAAEEDGETLSTDELITTCILLLNAGHEATVHSLGNGVKTLLEEGVVPTTESAEAITEEILRFDPPLHMFTRWAYEPVELSGHVIQPGDQVACLLAAANRDPAAYQDPARFDAARPLVANTSFGAGAHFCVGAPLARLELQIALPILWERCPDLRLAAPPEYANVYHFHGLKSLRVEI
ncbi:Cytochrome P450 107B1 [Pseudoruegeria aquimaris]|uniref:Cytochrome P450 107B1 n=1 Tax=Pseudoruegeria aquimaris TaxID=393663 RepID=A0A1Y5RQI8_9RHOB|nr:cytochrome P450 [Pseudoruegeria aquimaris]SLN22943.1 Cytochrome P450 107B1 [Pseudoruegeria aquimaris]